MLVMFNQARMFFLYKPFTFRKAITIPVPIFVQNIRHRQWAHQKSIMNRSCATIRRTGVGDYSLYYRDGVKAFLTCGLLEI